ncbi:hypothetical protein DdX_16913 [Ditylenchus destructor]|uniref:Uncharacterized protein n=1 Tax=Ditylenchus destructor TaxID=166010 RepID=A0AAD4MPL2_9BILA|nr:hypothetical protein DdX_16913 [Ditylenchus destructor]
MRALPSLLRAELGRPIIFSRSPTEKPIDHKAKVTQMLDNDNSATATSSLSGMASLGMPNALRSSSKASGCLRE